MELSHSSRQYDLPTDFNLCVLDIGPPKKWYARSLALLSQTHHGIDHWIWHTPSHNEHMASKTSGKKLSALLDEANFQDLWPLCAWSYTLYPKGLYRWLSNMRRTLIGNKIVHHSDVVRASPVGAAPTTSSFSTWASDVYGLDKDNCKARRKT